MSEAQEAIELTNEGRAAAAAMAAGIAVAILGRGTIEGIGQSIETVRGAMDGVDERDDEWLSRFFETACYMIATIATEDGEVPSNDNWNSVISNMFGLGVWALVGGEKLEVIVNTPEEA
jgi:hypothetical protein